MLCAWFVVVVVVVRFSWGFFRDENSVARSCPLPAVFVIIYAFQCRIKFFWGQPLLFERNGGADF